MTFDHWYVAGIGFTAGFFTACVLIFVAGWLLMDEGEIEESGR